MRKFTSLGTAAAIVITSVGLSATSAEARGRHGGWGYRHHDRVDAGDIIGGILILGTIAAIASAASKSKDRPRQDRDYRYDPPYRPDDQRQDQYDRGDADRDNDNPARYPGSDDASARATDACGWAVEGELGDEEARVDNIIDTQRNGDGWYVTGTASTTDGSARSFGCTYRNGRVVDVSFG